MALYQNGLQRLAYVCADAYVNIVDVTDPAQPGVLGHLRARSAYGQRRERVRRRDVRPLYGQADRQLQP